MFSKVLQLEDQFSGHVIFIQHLTINQTFVFQSIVLFVFIQSRVV